MGRTRNRLFISDLQIPFHAAKALEFCKSVAKEFQVAPEDVFNVGDETDQYFGSLFDKDPDALHTPNSEIAESVDELKRWYRTFPEMKLATSNHGIRWAKRAFKAGIPSQILRPYREIIQAPRGWVWKDEWLIPTPAGLIVMFHGMGYSGMNAARAATLDCRANVIFGHLHSHAALIPVTTRTGSTWGMNVGCLIDLPAYAFHYGKDSRWKPWRGVGVVADDGRRPMLIPYEGP